MPNPEHNFPSYSGPVYLQPQDEQGVATSDFLGPCYIDVFEGKNEGKRRDVVVKAKGDRGMVAHSHSIGGKSMYKITLKSLPRLVMADAVGAVLGETTDGVISATAEAHVAPEPGKWAKVVVSGAHIKRLTAATFAVKGSGGTPTYVLGTDYELNAAAGLWRPIIGGSIAEDADVELDVARAGSTLDQLAVGKGTTVRWQVLSDMQDDAHGTGAQVDGVFVGESTAAINLFADDDLSATFEGVFLEGAVLDMARPA